MKKLLLFFCSIGIISAINAQVPIDTILKKANAELYENPANAISVGKKILTDKKANPQQKIESLLLISTGYSSQRNYVKSLEYVVLAAQMLPKIKDEKFKFIVNTRLGLQYQQLQIYDKAHSYLDKAIQVSDSKKDKTNFDRLLGFNYAVRGMLYKEQMSCDIAHNYFNKSLYYYKRSNMGLRNYGNVSVIVYNKGNCFLAGNQIDSAQICFTNSFKFAVEIKAKSLMAFAQKGLAEVYTLEGNHQGAIDLLLQASDLSENVGDLVLNQGIYKGLADNYIAINAIPKYQLYRGKYEKTTAKISSTNSKTLNQFIKQINAESDTELDQIRSNSRYYQIVLAIVILILLWIVWCENTQFRKKIQKLKTMRQHLEESGAIR